METIRELLISLGLEVEQAEFIEAIGLEHLLEKGAEMLVEALEEIPKALAEVVHETAEYSHQLEAASERTGISTEKLQQFAYVAGLAGADAGEMEQSVSHLARSMNEARNGSGEAVMAFGKLRTRVTDGNGHLRDFNDVLLDISDGLHRLPPGAERAAAAQAVFGRGGIKMVGVLGQGRAAIAAIGEEFEALGGGMTEEAVKQGADLEKQFFRLTQVATMLRHELAGPLIEAINPVVEEIVEWVKENRELIRSRLLAFANAVVTVARLLARVFLALGKAVSWVVDHLRFFAILLGTVVAAALLANIGSIITALTWYVALGVQATLAAAKAAAAWIAAAAPVLLITGLLVLLALALDDIKGYLEGEDSLLGDIGPKWTAFLNSITKVHGGEPEWLKWLKAAAAALSDIQGFWESLRGPTGGASFFTRALGVSPDAEANIKRMGGHVVLPDGATGPAGAAGLSPASGSGDLNAHIEIHPPAGTSAEAIAHESVKQLEEWHARKMREALAAGGG